MDSPSPDAKGQLVHVVDDDGGIRAALDLALTIAGYRVRQHRSALEFLRAIEPHETGCVITDMRMPDMTGIELLEAMKARNIVLPTIVITAYGEIPVAVEAMKLGAVDFLEKPFDNAVVIEAVARGFLHRHRIAQDAETRLSEIRLATLTVRERDILSGLLKGEQNKVIAHRLAINVRTVESHRAHIMEKMKAKTIRELMRMVLFLSVD